MSERKAYILCNFARHSSLYTSWMDRSPLPIEVVESFSAQWQPPVDAGIVITHMHYRWEEVSALRRIYDANRVPVLILADGILEYRNLYEHPDLADGCIFQPVVGHKLACIGRAQAHMIESWGNVGKCEVVGLPRLDPMLVKSAKPIQTSGPFRLLIATASTPAFNATQRESVVESLVHFKQRLEANNRVNGRKLEITWRLTGGLDHDLGLSCPTDPLPSLSEAIDEADAVITTPSTLFLESILKSRPTAMLDFYNAPQFVSAAWTINAPKHVNAILAELAQPPASKMLYQTTTLHEHLECLTPATPRMTELISEMVACGRRARDGGELQFPLRILSDARRGFAAVEPSFDLARLFPENRTFDIQDRERLQVELNLAIARLGSMPNDLADAQSRIVEQQAQINNLKELVESYRERFEHSRVRFGELRSRLRQRREAAERRRQSNSRVQAKPPGRSQNPISQQGKRPSQRPQIRPKADLRSTPTDDRKSEI